MRQWDKDRGIAEKRNTLLDALLQGGMLFIGAAEAAHLMTLVMGWSFHRCAGLFLGVAALLCVLGAGYLLLQIRNRMTIKCSLECSGPGEGIPWGMAVVFAALLLSQLLFVCMGDCQYRQGDLTVETVESFLATDGIYQVNPLTGQPYTEGIPSRLKILCLPTLYGSLCKLLKISPLVLVHRIVPVVTLLGCYTAFAALGRCLFSERKKRVCFLIAVAILLWTGTYLYGMDGFNLLYCGWRGVSIRNGVLLPWLISLCLRKKWFSVLLCILAEACMVWTFYGMGVCLLATVGMIVAGVCCGFFRTSEKQVPSAVGKEKEV